MNGKELKTKDVTRRRKGLTFEQEKLPIFGLPHGAEFLCGKK